jgi:hypothetical protein
MLDLRPPRMERSQPTSGRRATPADINRNGRPTSIGTGGRHQIGTPGRHDRNPQFGCVAPCVTGGDVAFSPAKTPKILPATKLGTSMGVEAHGPSAARGGPVCSNASSFAAFSCASSFEGSAVFLLRAAGAGFATSARVGVSSLRMVATRAENSSDDALGGSCGAAALERTEAEILGVDGMAHLVLQPACHHRKRRESAANTPIGDRRGPTTRQFLPGSAISAGLARLIHRGGQLLAPDRWKRERQ